MKHKDELLQLLDSVIACGESMAKLGRLLKESISENEDEVPVNTQDVLESKENDAPEKPSKKTQPEEKAYTFADVRKAFSAKSHAGYTAQVKELISKYGADKLSGIKEEDYPALMADLEVII